VMAQLIRSTRCVPGKREGQLTGRLICEVSACDCPSGSEIQSISPHDRIHWCNQFTSRSNACLVTWGGSIHSLLSVAGIVLAGGSPGA
jgi:hypothetical protein